MLTLQASSKALVRISGVYGGGGTRTGGENLKGSLGGVGHRKKTQTTTSDGDESGELPSAVAVARFAIERERLAREIGMEELSGPATLGVVNVGARRQRGGSDGNTGRQRAPARRKGGGHGGGGGEAGNRLRREEEEELQDGRSAGEILLEKLESFAEARNFQVKYLPCGQCCVHRG